MLSKCRRSDDKHFNFCQNVTKVKVSDYNNNTQDINICYTNKKRIEINDRIMKDKYNYMLAEAKRKKKKVLSNVILEKNDFSSLSQKVYLFKGVPVIAIKNKDKEGFVNSEKYIVDDVDDDNIYLHNDMKDLTIPKNKFQSWFHVAYCITSHKSQGETIKVPYTIHDWDRMSETCKYVSLSRGTCWENVNLV